MLPRSGAEAEAEVEGPGAGDTLRRGPDRCLACLRPHALHNLRK
jgi:hypothetical protein